MTHAADHSTSGAIIGGSLHKDGYVGVIRYAAEGRANVNITPSEARDLKRNGIAIGIVLEHEANWLLHTASVAGRVSGSREICRACGLPDGVIYMAADFDVTNGGPTAPGSPGDQNMHTVLASLLEAAAVIGDANVGFYGSKFAIDWLQRHAPWIKFYWQTEAWSHGQFNPTACLFQRAASAIVGGVQVDIDDVLKPSWGQRVQPVKPKPRPIPKVHPKIAAAAIAGAIVTGLQALLHAHGVGSWHPTPAESSAITLAAATLAGFLKNAPTTR